MNMLAVKTLIILCFFQVSHLFASEPKSAFIQEFVESDINVKDAKESQESLLNQVKQVRGSLFPQISAQVSKTSYKNLNGSTGSADSYQASIDLTQPIYTGGKLFSALDLAKTKLRKAEIEKHIAIEQSKIAAWAQLLKIVSTEESLKIAKDQLQLQKRNLNIVKRKIKFGNAKSYELNQAKADLLAREIKLNQLELSSSELKKNSSSRVKTDILNSIYKLVRNSKFSEINFVSSIKTLESQFSISNFGQLLESNPEILNILASDEELTHSHKIEMGEDMPSLALVASQGYSSSSKKDWFDSSSETNSLSITAKVPLFSGLSSRYKKKAQLSAKRSLENKKRELKRNLELEFNRLKRELQTKQLILKQHKSWLNQSRLSLMAASKSYKNAQISFLQLLQIQSSLDQANSQFWSTWSSYHLSLLRFNYLVGGKLP